jgi:elongation factor G
VKFNGVLHDSHELDSVHLKPLPLPKPMFGLAIELKNHADESQVLRRVHKLMAEDPCFLVERIAATNQTVMRGLGELHLRVIIEKLKHQYNIELLTSQPKVAYKETITTNADGHHRHKKQTGGAGQFGEVYLRVEPAPGDHPEGFEFVNDTVGGSIPRQFIPAVEKGVARSSRRRRRRLSLTASASRSTTASTTTSTARKSRSSPRARKPSSTRCRRPSPCCSSPT